MNKFTNYFYINILLILITKLISTFYIQLMVIMFKYHLIILNLQGVKIQDGMMIL